MATIAPGGTGGPPGDDPNPNPNLPQDAGDSDEDFTDEEEFYLFLIFICLTFYYVKFLLEAFISRLPASNLS